LAATARRAGWVGSKIVLAGVPESGKVWLVRGGEALPRDAVLERWRSTCPPLTLRAFVAENAKSLAFSRRVARDDHSSLLREAGAAARGWLIEVMKCVEAIGRPAFTLGDVYAFEGRLAPLYPGNRHVRPKIRQQLQVLRDRGWLEFTGRGRYRVRASG
jgi:type II restriction enzyme